MVIQMLAVVLGAIASVPVVPDDDCYCVNADGQIQVIPTENDQGEDLQIVALGSPANGTVTLNGDGSVTYTPFAGFIGTDSFSYTVEDINGNQATAYVDITVYPNT
ncbi:MAG: Ig-like domain-containing protein [Planctomycetota bacterium]